MNKKEQQLAAFAFGIAFVVALLALAILFPAPTPFQYSADGVGNYSTIGGTMAPNVQSQGPGGSSRRSLRLTFRVADGEVRLVGYERLDMIPPPSIGERPEAGKHGGFWMELRDTSDRVLFHRVLDNPLGDSVEVHSPDGKIQRVFGAVKENVFEVLLPDDSNAETVALMGESLEPVTLRKREVSAAGELARFAVPKGMKGGAAEIPGGGQ
jgi:hypothetical protein